MILIQKKIGRCFVITMPISKNSYKKIILLPVEISSRELLSKVLLANQFASNNCVVFLGDKQSILEISRYTKNSIYFDKGYHKNVSEGIYKTLKQNSIKIISLDEENAVDFKDFQQLDLRFPDNILQEFELIFLWGKKQYEFLKKNRDNFNLENIFVSGHPRFDLLKDNLNSVYKREANRIKSEFGKFILVNTNFGLGNNLKGNEFIIKNYGSRFPQIKKLIEYQSMQVNNFIKLCQEISYFKDFNIILRPHPEENLELYKENLAAKENVFVLKEGSVIPWIMSSEVMIHHDCTTSIESAMLGKNSIAYTKDINRDLTTDIPLRISYDFDSIDKINDYIKNISIVSKKINKDILEEYFNFNSSSTSKIIGETLKIDSKDPKIKKYNSYKIKRFIKDLVKKILKKEDPLYEKKMEGLNLKNLITIKRKYDTIFSTNTKIIEVHKRLFKITNES